MDELEFAEGVLATAEEIRKLPLNQEIVSRFIVSKLYYGAHHLGRLLLKKQGEYPDLWLSNVHIRTLRDLKAKFVDTGLLSLRAHTALRTLRFKRIKADYFLTKPFQMEEIDKVFRIYREFLNEVRLLLPSL